MGENEELSLATITAFQKGDPAAFQCIFNRYWLPMYTKACMRVEQAEAKDLIQEIMVSIWIRRTTITLSSMADLEKYLFAALKYRVISHYAYTQNKVRNLTALHDYLKVNTATANTMEINEMEAMIEKEVSQLPPKMQTVFRLSRNEQLSLTEIAEQLHLSKQTVKNQLSASLKRLRASLAHHMNDTWMFFL